MMYQIMKFEQELAELRATCKAGEQNQATINRIFEIQLVLDNVYYTEF